jgi:hypothetical protein
MRTRDAVRAALLRGVADAARAALALGVRLWR